MLRLAVVGHVEHVTLGRAEAPFGAGDIVHLRDPRFLPGGGGGIAFAQLSRANVELHFFTAVGDDAGGEAVLARVLAMGDHVRVHAATRAVPHPRVVVILGPDGRRTIVVTGGPLQPASADPLGWSILGECHAVYFTGADPETLAFARASSRLVVTARRKDVLRAARVAPDVLVGSVADPRENAPLASYDPPPGALVLTDGARPIRVVRGEGEILVEAPPAPPRVVGDYGAGDSFAGALTFFLAHGVSVEEACLRAGPYGAAVLAGVDPLENQRELVAP